MIQEQANWVKSKCANYNRDVEEQLVTEDKPHYYNNNGGSLYEFCNRNNLNAWEFDLIKRIMRCRKKGNFKEDLEKTKFLIDLYLKEYTN